LEEIGRRGWRLKSWTRKKGGFRAGGPFTLSALRRLLSNILYTVAIRHKGQTYPGQHDAILAPDVWERAQGLIAQRAPVACGGFRNKHLALLSGLLHCESCAAPMVYSYSGKNGRRYPYYVCRNAQRKGWAVCPAKSLPARAIEESIGGQIREAQCGMLDATEWEHMHRGQQIEIIRAIVERIGYDGTAGQVSIGFRQPAMPAAGQEAQA
jgi:site-specific DNA recombinase